MEGQQHHFHATALSMPQFNGTGDLPYPTEHTLSADRHSYGGSHSAMASPTKGNKKTVTFELYFEGVPDYKGRLPLRVGISPHDTTESIIAVVKNFYGIYSNTISGISFEDKETGSVIIPRFENFDQDMHVVVKILPAATPSSGPQAVYIPGAVSPTQAAGFNSSSQVVPSLPSQILQHPPSRPSSRIARKQSASPKLGAAPGLPKSRSRNGPRSTKTSFQDGLDELSDAHGYSSGDNAPGSVTSSRLGTTAEISVENIVEGGRRNYANFESSQLPLYAPPQVPTMQSVSSVSPQRRSAGLDNPSPFEKSTQKTFAWTQPLPSPQSYTFEQPQAISPAAGTFQIPAVPKHGRSLRDRNSGASVATNRSSLGGTGPRRSAYGILPTPDPTVASTISDEDVALQLMRLSDMSNFSHGRTSASALDETMSGRADAASSASDDEDEHPLPTVHPTTETHKTPKRKNAVHELPSYDSIEHIGDDADGDYDTGMLKSEYDEDDTPRAKMAKTKSTMRARNSTKGRAGKTQQKARTGSTSTTMTAPNTVRKTSSATTLTFAHQPGADEDDLSSKPRCQRCRKSKKGCDRQRPCGRCQDAGIGVDGCVSEDEGNGRKGRYGRHMGVPVKKDSLGGAGSVNSPSDTQTPDAEVKAASAVLENMGSPADVAAKKRKRV